MENVIVFDRNKCRVNLNTKAVSILDNMIPKGCPFLDYTMLDLLFDLINMYSWKIPCGEMPIAEYIRFLQNDKEIKSVVYGNVFIKVFEMEEKDTKMK